MAQYLTPSGLVLDETGAFQALSPDGSVLNESGQGGASETELSLVASSLFGAASRSTASGNSRYQTAVSLLWSSSSVATAVSGAFGISASGALGFAANVQSTQSYQFLTTDGGILNETGTLTALLPGGSIVTESSSGQQTFIGQSTFGISSAGSIAWGTGVSRSGSANLAPSTGMLWQGDFLSTAGAAVLSAQATLAWKADVGAALYIFDDQTTISATGASIASSALVISGAGIAQWQPTQVPTDTDFSISGTAAINLDGVGVFPSVFSIVSSSQLALFPADITASVEVDVNVGSSFTFGSETINPTGPFVIEAAALIQWNSLPTVFESSDLGIAAGSLLQFTTAAIGPTPAQLAIAADALLKWRSTRDLDDDDETEDDRRRIWAGAAEAEREALARSRIYDEEELALFSAALAGAYAQYRKGLQ